MIDVLNPGLSTTVQDAGRPGHYHIGMPPSGAMDQFAHAVANYLVGNDEDAATLEMTYQGCDLEFGESALIAVTGADMSPTLDDEPIPTWTAVEVDAGQELSFEFSQDGVRSYLAVAGGFDVPEVMGSSSTYTLIGLGGYEGRELEAGDTLQVADHESRPEQVGTAVPDEHVPDYSSIDVRVVMGLCDYRLTDEGRERFLDADWKVSDEADRVGYRFEGPDITDMFEERDQPFGAGTDVTNVVDLGYPIGSIQMAGQPIVLMRDAVTGGGYATVGTLISTDRGTLSQCRVHSTVNFQAVDVDTALEVRAAQDETLQTLRDTL
ncbi:biotin-dependent carboxyltransferase family protein [Halorientalis brevis]|uniref:Biotin-dependent carboxyltransferase family protein n=1 Tax=Halorientalis brevis TaxID=1126241 RepID=A0ABD6CEN3_9EURY|nr:biotin-dependent carboxyltransferase family protein [Halorientalis brevis]